LIMSSWHPPA